MDMPLRMLRTGSTARSEHWRRQHFPRQADVREDSKQPRRPRQRLHIVSKLQRIMPVRRTAQLCMIFASSNQPPTAQHESRVVGLVHKALLRRERPLEMPGQQLGQSTGSRAHRVALGCALLNDLHRFVPKLPSHGVVVHSRLAQHIAAALVDGQHAGAGATHAHRRNFAHQRRRATLQETPNPL
eukprot:scaffold64_cov248-Pinguiococcus_pyrenoidosus.AAC.10